MAKTYWLLDSNGKKYASGVKGLLGGHSKTKKYGRMDCPAALRAIAKGGPYPIHRVFFADEDAAIAAGFVPCHSCMRERYKQWKAGGEPGTRSYPWAKMPI